MRALSVGSSATVLIPHGEDDHCCTFYLGPGLFTRETIPHRFCGWRAVLVLARSLLTRASFCFGKWGAPAVNSQFSWHRHYNRAHGCL